MDALLTKTEIGRQALAPGDRTLTPRERMLVLLADGQRSAQDLLGLVAGTRIELVHDLLTRGFLARETGAARGPTLPAGVRHPTVPAPAAAAATPPEATEPSPPESPWVRSAAATKLYLMDVAERTFARADPAQWELLREMLRDVRDDDGLLQALQFVMQAIARAAGEERARAIRSQLLRA